MIPISSTDASIQYRASSPDELALLEFARRIGFVLQQRSANTLTALENRSGSVQYELLATCPFSSSRARMSVVIRHPGTRKILLLCKGADSKLLTPERISTKPKHNPSEMTPHLKALSSEGLRTLVFAYRSVQQSDFDAWFQQYEQAANSVAGNRSELLDQCFGRLEVGLKVVGVSGIEDALAEGVPESIASLLTASIRVWVLTGDRVDTALAVAKAAQLLPPSPSQPLTICNMASADDVAQRVTSLLDQWQPSDPAPSLVIDGASLQYALVPPLVEKLVK